MIIDTMVMAYALLNVADFGAESSVALRMADTIAAPSSVETELLNVLWQWGRTGLATRIIRQGYMEAENAWDELIPVSELWKDALHLAVKKDHSPYDTLFIVAARNRGTRVLTYDKRMLELFPKDTITVADFLGGK